MADLIELIRRSNMERCPRCGLPLREERSHYRCEQCGIIEACCEGMKDSLELEEPVVPAEDQ